MQSQEDLAKHLDLSTRRVRELANLGIIKRPKGKEGWDLDHNRFAYINYLRELSKKTGADLPPENEEDPSSPELNKERALLVREQRRTAQIKNEKELKTLLPIDVVIAIYGDLVASARNKILSIEGQVMVSLPELSKADVRIVRGMLHKALSDLSDADTPPPRLIAYLEESSSDLGATTEPNDSPMG
ncbi:hypothetical protein EYS14_03415 [Alteromonadaceae bacterium M269]|nr:hypothetical protein EYS14_03415 [Alteromonadaceae bacterium M269]